MNPKTSLLTFAAGLLAATLALPLGAAQPGRTRLFEIGVHRYVPEAGTGRILEKRYRLDAMGQLRPTATSYVPAAVTIPDEAFDKVLLTASAWVAYQGLGDEAMANFEVDDSPIWIADRGQFVVTPRDDAKLDVGDIVNLSSRGLVAPDRPLTGGFVVLHQARTVLVRAVGPTLSGFGVTNPLPNPVLTIFKSSMPLYENDDWGSRPDRDEIVATTTRVGAFPLPAGSADAVLLVELPPGAYTARAASMDARSGDVLLEIYLLP